MTGAERPGRRHSRRRPGARMVIGAALVVGTLVVWGGCSVEKHYELLNFFFDGVPEPEAVRAARMEEEAGRPGAPAVIRSSHLAFVERRCEACHGATRSFGFEVSGFSEIDGSVCVTCHADVGTTDRFVHGPVAVGECLWCHEPHDSVHPWLLRQRPNDLCLQCHGFTFRQPDRIPDHADELRSCLDCHAGHGSDHPALLRPAYFAPPPADAVPGTTPDGAPVDGAPADDAPGPVDDEGGP